VVVVSNDGANTTAQRLGRGVVTVLPATTYVSRIHPFQVLLPADRCQPPRDSRRPKPSRSGPSRVGSSAGSLLIFSRRSTERSGSTSPS